MIFVPVNRASRSPSPHLSRLLDDSVQRFFGPTAAEDDAVRSPALDVAETDSAYTVKLDVPGVGKEDIKVSVEGRQVSVQANSQPAPEAKDGERVVYRERAATRYARSFSLRAEVDQAEAVAKLEHGVLTLTLPKRSARSAAQISVN